MALLQEYGVFRDAVKGQVRETAHGVKHDMLVCLVVSYMPVYRLEKEMKSVIYVSAEG